MSKDPNHQSDPSLLTRNQQRLLKQRQWQERLKKLEEKERWMKEHPIIPAYKPRLSESAPFWEEFWRQKDAFSYTAAHQQDVHTFAFETENLGNGPRKFLVTSYKQLWHKIQALAQHNHHGSFYEIIQEGAACKLYFDLEFGRDSNPDLDGSAMVQTLIKFVICQLREYHNVNCHERHVINLDASTSSKFSCHLVFNIPGVAFKDTTHAGNFVHDICERIHAACNSNPPSPLSAASVSPGTDQDKVSTTSTGAREEEATNAASPDSAPLAKRKRGNGSGSYTDGGCRNESTGCDDIGYSGDCAEGCGERHDLHTLYVNTMDGTRELFIDTAVYTRNRNFRLFKCVKLGKKNPLLVSPGNKYVVRMTQKRNGTSRGEEFQFFLDSIITNVKFTVDTKILTCAGSKKRPGHMASRRPTEMEEQDDDEKSEVLEGYHSSPLPEIDSFVRRHCISEGGVVGDIRRWTYFSQPQLLLFDISKNRWCENVGRQHRSNNIMIVVDLRHGVYYQKCHDPVCKEQNFKSEEKPVPPEFLPSFTEWDEEELIALADQVEQSCHGNNALNEEGIQEENLGSERDGMRDSTNGELKCQAQRFQGGEIPGISSDAEDSDSLWDESITDDELMKSFHE